MELQQAIEIVKANGYIVRKSTKGITTRAGSLKDWRVKQQEPKVNFVCFKSRLRYAGLLQRWDRLDNLGFVTTLLKVKDKDNWKTAIDKKIASL